MAAADNFDAVFTFDNLYHSYKKCCLGVGWKASTQRYRVNAIVNVNDTLRQLKEGKFKSRGFYTFIRIERGKERNIKSVHISERVVQRCLCDYSLIPILSRSFIYDNSACMAGKGIHFAVNRLVCHLQRHYRKYGKNGYALVFDFSKYFDNIEHKPLKDIIDSEYTDTRLAGACKTTCRRLRRHRAWVGVANIAGVRLAVPEQTRPLHQRSVAYQGLRTVYGRRLFVTQKQRILAKVFVGHQTNLRRTRYQIEY